MRQLPHPFSSLQESLVIQKNECLTDTLPEGNNVWQYTCSVFITQCVAHQNKLHLHWCFHNVSLLVYVYSLLLYPTSPVHLPSKPSVVVWCLLMPHSPVAAIIEEKSFSGWYFNNNRPLKDTQRSPYQRQPTFREGPVTPLTMGISSLPQEKHIFGKARHWDHTEASFLGAWSVLEAVLNNLYRDVMRA